MAVAPPPVVPPKRTKMLKFLHSSATVRPISMKVLQDGRAAVVDVGFFPFGNDIFRGHQMGGQKCFWTMSLV